MTVTGKKSGADREVDSKATETVPDDRPHSPEDWAELGRRIVERAMTRTIADWIEREAAERTECET